MTKTSTLRPAENLVDLSDTSSDFYNEKALSKIFRKLKEEPLIPLGATS